MAVIKGNTSSFPPAFLESVYRESVSLDQSDVARVCEVVDYLRKHPNEQFFYTFVGKSSLIVGHRTDDEILVYETQVTHEHTFGVAPAPIALPKSHGVRYACTFCDQTLTEVSPGQYRCARCV